MHLNFITRTGALQREVAITHAIVAGWTSRDAAAMEQHIAELEALGVPRPKATPMYYRVAATRLTTSPRIEVCGTDSSGEVEFVLLQLDGQRWIGIGSDHTDRRVEAMGVTISKQLCEKPIGPDWWLFDEVADHWDALVLRAHVIEDGRRVLYQEGPVTVIRDPRELVAGYAGPGADLPEGTAMFCGTLAARGGVRFAPRFELELCDPVLGRTLRHAYDVEVLPIAG